MNPLEITYLPVASLTPAKRNARTHSLKQIGQIADSLKAFGWTSPILISDDGRIVAGHGRAEAAKLLAMAEVPTIRLSQLSPEQCRLYALADNRLAELAGWDRKLLAVELGELCELDLNIDIELTGFEMAEIDVLLDETMDPYPADSIPDVATTKPAVTRPGDV